MPQQPRLIIWGWVVASCWCRWSWAELVCSPLFRYQSWYLYPIESKLRIEISVVRRRQASGWVASSRPLGEIGDLKSNWCFVWTESSSSMLSTDELFLDKKLVPLKFWSGDEELWIGTFAQKRGRCRQLHWRIETEASPADRGRRKNRFWIFFFFFNQISILSNLICFEDSFP